MTHSHLPHSAKGGVEALSEVPVDDGSEYSTHSVVLKLIHGDARQMPREPGCDVVASTTRGAHCRHKQLQDTNSCKLKMLASCKHL